MSNLKVIENSEKYFIEKKEEVNAIILLPTRSFLQKSFDFEKISELKKNQNFVFLITGWIAQTSLLMQVKAPVDNMIKQDIINMLTTHMKNLSFEELIKAFELERYNIYEEKTEHYQLFDAAYISTILKKYKKWKIQEKTNNNIVQQLEEKTMNQEEIDKIMNDAVNNRYAEYLETGDISEPYTNVFKHLIEIGVLKMPTLNTPKLEIYYSNKIELARKQIKEEYRNKTSEDKGARKQFKEIVQAIVSNEKNQSYDLAKSKIEIRAKKLVLIDLFKAKKEQGLTSII